MKKYLPLAVLVAILPLGTTALAADSYTIADSRSILTQILELERGDQPVTPERQEQEVAPERHPDQQVVPDLPAAPAAEVDTRGVWFRIDQGDLARAEAELDRLRAENPDWRPPAQLVEALGRLRVRQAVAAGDQARLVAVARRWPGLFGCDNPDNAWALGEALGGMGAPGARRQLYLNMAERCRDPDIARASLDRALVGVDAGERARILTEAGDRDLTPRVRQRLSDLEYGADVAELGTLSGDAGLAAARAQAERLGDRVIQRQDAESAQFLGYLFLQAGAPDDAWVWFDRALRWGGGDAARQGAVQAAIAQGDFDRAADLVETPEQRRLLGDAMLDRALAALDAGDLDRAEAAARQATDLGRDDARAVLADVLMGRALDQLAAGDFDAAEATMVRAQALGRTGAEKTLADALVGQAIEEIRAGRYATAEVTVARAARLGRPDARRLLADSILDRALTLARQGDIAGARTQAARAKALGRQDADRVLADVLAARAVDIAEAGGDGAAEVAAAEAATLGRRDAWTALGWARLDQDQPAEALAAFAQAPDTADAQLGRAIALQRTGDIAAARTLACDQAGRSGDLADLCAGLLAAAANDRYQADDYAGVLALADQARDLGIESPDLSVLEGWSLLRTGRPEAAADIFRARYRAAPGRDTAEGLVTALDAAGANAELAELARRDDGPLWAVFREQRLRTAFDRKMFTATADLAGDDPLAGMAGYGGPHAGAGVFGRYKEGDAGRDRVRLIDAAVMGDYTAGSDRFAVRVDTIMMDIGVPDTGSAVGFADTGAWTHTPSDGATLAMPTASWQRQSFDWSVAAAVGLSPIGGEVGPLPNVWLDGAWYVDDVALSASLFHQNRWDSLLSAAGMVDPVTGGTWGRVMEAGGLAQAVWSLAPDWSVSASGGASGLYGDNVAGNSRLTASAGASYDFTPVGFDYLWAGPLYVWEHYADNRAHFTWGHGGYYSPDAHHLAGLAVEGLTEEGADWQIEGKLFAGWSYSDEADSARFPLTGTGGTIAGSVNQGLAADAQIRAAWRVADHWLVGGLARASMAPDYRDYALGLTLTYAFDGREGVFSSDLPEFFDRGLRF